MIEAYITSSTEGRLRLRHPFIRDIDLAMAIFTFLEGQPLSSVKVNPRTGSILIEYNPSKTTQNEIISNLEEYALAYCAENGYLEELLKFEEKPKASFVDIVSKVKGFRMKVQHRRLLNRSMLFFVASSIGFIFFNREREHIVTGAIFAMLASAHLYNYHNRL